MNVDAGCMFSKTQTIRTPLSNSAQRQRHLVVRFTAETDALNCDSLAGCCDGDDCSRDAGSVAPFGWRTARWCHRRHDGPCGAEERPAERAAD